MKSYFLVFTILLSFASKAQNPYALSFPAINGKTVNLSDYSGKKLLVVIVNAAAPNTAQLQLIDSFYQADDSILSVIALLVDDFGTPLDDSTLSAYLKDSLALHFVIGKTGKGSKSNGDDQQILLKWLTHVSDNNRFDNDFTQDGQMYLLSEKGSLFGEFEKQTSPLFLDSAIKQTIAD